MCSRKGLFYDILTIKLTALDSYSIWTPTFWPWWLRARTSIRSEVLSGWSWLTVWLGASSTKQFRERPEDQCTLCILKTGWWSVSSGVFSTLLFWSRCWEWPVPLSGSAVRILEHQVSQERVLCDWTVRGNGALQQHRVQLPGSTVRSSGVAAVLHFPIIHCNGGGHADWEGHHQPPLAEWVSRVWWINICFTFLNGEFLTLQCFFPHSRLAVRRDSVPAQDVPGSSETRNNNRTKSVSPSMKVN